jgi:hypothetical protein
MPLITVISVSTIIFTILVGAATVLREAGYISDSRRRNRRSGKDGRVGGRRAEDIPAFATS